MGVILSTLNLEQGANADYLPLRAFARGAAGLYRPFLDYPRGLGSLRKRAARERARPANGTVRASPRGSRTVSRGRNNI